MVAKAEFSSDLGGESGSSIEDIGFTSVSGAEFIVELDRITDFDTPSHESLRDIVKATINLQKNKSGDEEISTGIDDKTEDWEEFFVDYEQVITIYGNIVEEGGQEFDRNDIDQKIQDHVSSNRESQENLDGDSLAIQKGSEELSDIIPENISVNILDGGLILTSLANTFNYDVSEEVLRSELEDYSRGDKISGEKLLEILDNITQTAEERIVYDLESLKGVSLKTDEKCKSTEEVESWLKEEELDWKKVDEDNVIERDESKNNEFVWKELERNNSDKYSTLMQIEGIDEDEAEEIMEHDGNSKMARKILETEYKKENLEKFIDWDTFAKGSTYSESEYLFAEMDEDERHEVIDKMVENSSITKTWTQGDTLMGYDEDKGHPVALIYSYEQKMENMANSSSGISEMLEDAGQYVNDYGKSALKSLEVEEATGSIEEEKLVEYINSEWRMY
ncbi:MAG: hypothetical protein ABEJ56_01730 [Candidatus Nanohaloarchaea archaeon]